MNPIQEIESTLNRLSSNGVHQMSEYDYDVCSFVAGELVDDKQLVLCEKDDLKINDVCSRLYDLLCLYGDEIISKYIKFTNSLPFNPIPISNNAMRITNFSTIIDPSFLKNGYFTIQRMCFPEKLDCLSPIYLGHEFHHAFKDINPNEYQYKLRFADVIPIFFELVISEKVHLKMKNAILDNRITLLKFSKDALKRHLERDSSNIIFDLSDSKSCQYLNSFYYAVLLYIEYISNPQKTLSDVRNVLLCRCTTYDLLVKYDFLCRVHDSDFKQYIKTI